MTFWSSVLARQPERFDTHPDIHESWLRRIGCTCLTFLQCVFDIHTLRASWLHSLWYRFDVDAYVHIHKGQTQTYDIHAESKKNVHKQSNHFMKIFLLFCPSVPLTCEPSRFWIVSNPHATKPHHTQSSSNHHPHCQIIKSQDLRSRNPHHIHQNRML